METPEEIYDRRIRECAAVAADPNASIDERADAQEGLRLLTKYRDVRVGDVLERIAKELKD